MLRKQKKALRISVLPTRFYYKSCNVVVFLLKTPVEESQDDKRLPASILIKTFLALMGIGMKKWPKVSLRNENGKIKNPNLFFFFLILGFPPSWVTPNFYTLSAFNLQIFLLGGKNRQKTIQLKTNYRCFRNCSYSILAAIHNQNFLIMSLVTLKPIN